MKTQKIGYLLLCLSLVLIISGGFSSFLSGLEKDREEVMRRMEDVDAEFEGFNTNTGIFEEYRDNLYTEVLGNVYYETMHDTDESVKSTLSSYESIVDELGKSAKKLDVLCKNIYYPKSNKTHKCATYKSIYEQVVNYFVTDINTYNDNVLKYNEYQENINKELLVEEYHTKKQYIDYNDDGAFDGRED